MATDGTSAKKCVFRGKTHVGPHIRVVWHLEQLDRSFLPFALCGFGIEYFDIRSEQKSGAAMQEGIQGAPALHRVDSKLTPSNGFWIPELDGLRAFACALVVIAHFNPWIASNPFVYQSIILQPIKNIQGGNTGVMLFFCLSSFLLTSVCLADIDRHGHINLAAFFLRRILRIWPLYFFVLVVSMLLIWPGSPIPQAPGASTTPQQWAWAKQFAPLYGLFVGNWVDSTKNSEIGILWTICVEEQFYFALPFVLMWVARFRRQYLIIPLAVAATASSIIFFSHLHLSIIASPYYQTTTYISTFAFGGVAAFMLHRRQTMNQLANPMLLFACIVFLIIILSKNPDFWWGPYRLRAVTLYQIVPAMLAFIVWWVARHSGAWFLFFLRSRMVRTIGILSYGIYLTHVISHRFVNLESYLLGPPPSALTYHLLFIQYAAFAVFLAALTHGLVERPFLSIRKRFLPNKASAIDARWNVNWRQVAIIAGGLSTLCLFALVLVSVAV
jgi:peptidoglycan/LPS O-acetylase OafA/YrhL